MLTATWTGTNPNLIQLTQVELIKRVLAETGMGMTGTTTGNGSATTLVDATSLANVNTPTTAYIGGWVRITSGTRIGEIAPVTGYANSTGTLTIGTLTGAPGTGVTYELWLTNFSPAQGIDALTRLLTELYYVPCWTWFTEHPDGDMEQSGTDEYAGTNATLAKVSSQVGVNGRRALSVATTAANGYAESAASLRVTPATSVLCSVNFTPNSSSAATTGFLKLYDVTNSTVIDTISSSSKATVRLYKQIMIPPTCSAIKVRLGNEQNSVTSIWDELAIIDAQSSSVPLPWWVKRPGQVKGMYDWRPYQPGADQYEYEPVFRGLDNRRYEIRPDQTNSMGLRAVGKIGSVPPSFMFGVRNETAFPDLTTSKPLDENWITAGLAYQFLLMASARIGAFSINNKELEQRKASFLSQWNAARMQQVKECRAPESGPQPLIEV